MKTRREFLKRTGLTALAGVLGCGGDAASTPPDGATLTPDTGADDALDAEAPEDVTEPDVPDVPDVPEAPDIPERPDLPDYTHDGPLGPESLFQHGVASGDPLHDAVILWTRTTDTSLEPVPVFWEMATDEAFADRVAAGWEEATEATDFTVKVDAQGALVSGDSYYYRFQALGRTSPVGRTRLSARQGDSLERVRLAVASCADYGSGYYHAYGDMAEQDLDVVVFLGDYIYEYGSGLSDFRPVDPPHVATTLADYRLRYAQTRSDPDLQAAHRAHPWILVWDDHETANDAWRGGDGHGDTGEVWEARHGAAAQAWREWMPVRAVAGEPIYRAFDFGDLVRLVMLDTRIAGRDEQVNPNQPAGFDAPERQLLGTVQEAWLAGELVTAQKQGQWAVLGQQVMVAPLTDGSNPINYDQWDGYPAARTRLFDLVAEAGVEDLIVLTGDIHSSWASDLPRDATYDPETGDGSMGVEFVTPGITSGFPANIPELVDIAKLVNPHLKYADIVNRGYYVLDVDAQRADATWRYVADITRTRRSAVPGVTARCVRGSRRVKLVS